MSTRGPIWKVSIRTTPEAEEAVTELLAECFVRPVSSYTDVETREVTVATYLTKKLAGPDASGALPGLRAGLKRIRSFGLDIGSGKVSFQKIRHEDWAESWKRHFKPIEIGSALLIKPSWVKRKPRKGQAVIVLDPGLSFGTGQHPTTAFCLQEVVKRRFEFRVSSFESTRRSNRGNPKLETPNSKPAFLDIGTGSGILAIAAAKLGYRPVHGFDFDPEAVRIARGNARKNRVADKIRITRGDITKLSARSVKQYDLVCANLISTLLIAERRRILSRLKENGVLVLAGILKAEFNLVQQTYEKAGLRLIANRAEKEWQSGAFIYLRQK